MAGRNTAGQVGFSLVVVGYTWSRTPKPRDLFGRVWVAVAASAVMAAGTWSACGYLGGLPGVFVFTVLDFTSCSERTGCLGCSPQMTNGGCWV